MSRKLLLLANVPVLLFLALPVLVIVPMALTRGQLIRFPPDGLSVHSFVDYWRDPQWVASTWLSLRVALFASVLGGVAGGSAAAGMHGRRFRGSGLLTGVILAPIVLPLIVLALGDYLLFARLRLLGGWLAIGLAHGLLVTPYVFVSVQGSLASRLDPSLIQAARGLGAGSWRVLRAVWWPAIRPGLLAGCILAFAVSFDEVVIALFLQGPDATTLPVRMFTSIQFELTPKIAACASLFLGLASVLLVLQTLVARSGAIQRRPEVP